MSVAGIRTPLFVRDQMWVAESIDFAGVTEQFLSNAAVYADETHNREYWKWLVGEGLKRVALPPNPRILEIGAGSGNGTLALLALLPGATILATDISPQLLSILRDHLTPSESLRVELVCADALALSFESGAFDFAVGTAILHHLFDPEILVLRVGAALKQGASALFFEPFETGNDVLRIIMEHLIREADALSIPEPTLERIGAMVFDTDIRTNLKRADPVISILDDKWLFTFARLERMAKAAGFSGVTCFSYSEPEALFEGYLRFSLGSLTLPDAAWEIVRHYDGIFSPDAKRELIFDGGIVFSMAQANADSSTR
jgi:SAM-dependent methyltransferase